MTVAQNAKPNRFRTFVRSHPAAVYFVATFAISWTGALIIVAPVLLRHQGIPKMTGILMFPVMLLGPSVTSIVLTAICAGKSGLSDLFSRMKRADVGPWYAGLFLPPSVILLVLFCLKTFVSPLYAPNHFWIGASFGVIAGLLEEIGWMGFAFPALCSVLHLELVSAVVLGLLWGLWHLPVIDFLGTATPHGRFLLPCFLAFVAAMTAMRVFIVWLYTNTRSILLAQLMHASSTASLVVLSPARVSARQEAMWYAAYACTLWIVVALVVLKTGVHLSLNQPIDEP